MTDNPTQDVGEVDLPSDALWTVPEVARYLRVSTSKVYKLVENKQIPFTKLPGSNLVRFGPEAIRQYGRGEWKPPAPARLLSLPGTK